MSQENLIVINVDLGETRVAIIENGIIAELLVERSEHRSLVGNVYRGKVTRVLKGMQAAFVDIGLERHAFLPASDLVPADENKPDGAAQKKKRKHPDPAIEKILKEGEYIVVQIAKDPIGTKGCRVTSEVSLAGRHLVYMPFSDKGGISRKIESEDERKRLGKILKRLAPETGALIARTVAERASGDALEADASYLLDIWDEIQLKNKRKQKTGLLYEELPLPLRAARDRLNDSVSEMVVDNAEFGEKLYSFVDRLMPSRLDAIRTYTSDEPIFDAFGIEAEIKRALDRVVELPSGGSLVIDQGEALTAVDVNTGKFTGKAHSTQEKIILQTNLEAVDEIAYQLKFRNIGGLIVLDLIDMDRTSNRYKVMSRLKEALENDRAKTSVIQISRFGLLEMTRERTRESLGRTLHEQCLYCDGTGQTLSRVTVANEVLREIKRVQDEFQTNELEVVLHPYVAEVFQSSLVRQFKQLQKMIGKKVSVIKNKANHLEQFEVRAKMTKAGGD